MSGLFGSLSNNVKALAAQSRALETTSRNLANVNNANYARQRVVFGDRGTVETPQGAQSLGLEALQIVQLRDRLLDQQVVREISITSTLTAQQAANEKAQAAIGQSVSSTSNSAATDSSTNQGLAESLSAFFTAFQSFAASPTDSGERQTLLQKASILADRIQLTDARLAQVQSDLTTSVQQDVENANTILATIASLNGQIGRLEINAPGSAADLRDQRQAKLEELSKLMSISSRPNTTEAGQLDVFTYNAAGVEIPLVNLATTTGPVTLSGSTISAGTPSTAVALTGGSIHGSLSARTGSVQTLRDQIDALAEQLVTSVNDAYNPTGSSGDFFLAAGTTAATFSLASGLTATSLKASDGGAAGDNTIASAVAALANTSFSTTAGDAIDGTFSQFYANAVSDLGQTLSGVNARLSDQQNIESIVRGQRDGVSGVSLDEEMADLVKYQRSFQAVSRVISVIDDLLDTVVNRLGA